MKRSSGILMPISALPSPNGIGTLGRAAYDFVDFLADAGQSWWQILPVGPTSYGDSPYQSPSAYAGNPYFIDLDLLVEDELLTEDEIAACDWGGSTDAVDYGLLFDNRLPLLRLAAARGLTRDPAGYLRFREEQAFWLEDYALFMALKHHFDMKSWQEWPDEAIRLRRPEAMDACRDMLAEDIRFFAYLQYLFFGQWNRLRQYARRRGIRIIGDLALYVALDSADVWASPENFLLNEKHVPEQVAGVPPDYFTADGQLWGNPLYNYAHMEADGFGWWIRRIGGAEKLYDAVRIDHFRGLESYWVVPGDETTARHGKWVQGPGMRLVRVLREWFPNIQFIAEDLGYPSPAVTQLLQESGFPGMKILQFAFDSRDSSNYLPHTYERNCICYAGTHDNDTLLGWRAHGLPEDLAHAAAYLGLNSEEGFVWGILRGGMSSVADLFIVQMQDYLELGPEARMNTPGTLEGNWRWRMRPDAITPGLTARIRAMTERYGRCP